MPIEGFRDKQNQQADETEWKYALEVCGEILELDDADIEWCEDLICGIRDWIKANKTVTPKQWRAINNVKDVLEERGLL